MNGRKINNEKGIFTEGPGAGNGCCAMKQGLSLLLLIVCVLYKVHANGGINKNPLPPVPVILNVHDQCVFYPSARGKLVNPPTTATITVEQNGLPLFYNPADSSFEYFTNGSSPAGTHTIQVKYTDLTGESTKDSTYRLMPVTAPAFTIATQSAVICQGHPANFISVISDGGFDPSYQWSVNGVEVSGSSPRMSFTSLQDGDIVSCVLTIDPFGSCTNLTTITSNPLTISVTPQLPPVVTVTTLDNGICPGSTATFEVDALYVGVDPVYQWKLNGQNVGTHQQTYSNSSLTDGDEISCMVITGEGSCVNAPVFSNIIPVTVHPLPVVSIYPDDTMIVRGNQLTLNATITGGYQSYTWSPATNMHNPSSLAPTIQSFTDDIEYTLTVISDEGCVTDKKTRIKVLNGLYIPTGFTPNNDGLNDVFYIPPRTLQKLKRFSIYNRWGRLVFTTTDISAGWDGRVKGSISNTGVYVYIIEGFDGAKNVTLKGTLTLVR